MGLAKSIIVVDFNDYPISNSNTVSKISKTYIQTFKLSNLLDRLNTRLKVILFTAGEFKDSRLTAITSELRKNIRSLRRYMCKLIKGHTANHARIVEYSNTTGYIKQAQRDKKLLWYESEASNDIMLLDDRLCNTKHKNNDHSKDNDDSNDSDCSEGDYINGNDMHTLYPSVRRINSAEDGSIIIK